MQPSHAAIPQISPLFQPFLVTHRNVLTAVLVAVCVAWLVQTACEEPLVVFTFSLPPLVSVLAALALCAAATYLMAELDNLYAMVRVSQRVVSTLFFTLLASAPAFHTLSAAHLSALCAVLLLFPLFASYQAPQLTVMHFLTFLCVGVSSLTLPTALLLALPLWVAQALLRTLSLKGVAAALLGLLFPYFWIFVGAYCLGQTDWLQGQAHEWLASFAWPTHPLSLPLIGPIGITLLLLAAGAVDIIRHSQSDRTRTRYQNYALLLLALWALLWLILQPQLADHIFPYLATPTAILAAHFLTLSHGRIASIIALTLSLLLLAICSINFVAPVLLSGG